VFVHGKPLQPSLTFTSKAGIYQSEMSFWCSTLAFPGLKGLPEPKTLAYDEHLLIADVKGLLTLGPGHIEVCHSLRWPKKLSGNKRSSLLCRSVSDDEKEFNDHAVRPNTPAGLTTTLTTSS
jgi:hypothetical protein